MQTAHAINYADPAIKGDGAKMCQNEVVRFVGGIRRPRQAPVSKKQILRWFPHTPDAFVDAQIDAACMAGRIAIRMRSLSSRRRANGSFVYEVA